MDYEQLVNYIEHFINHSWKVSNEGYESINKIVIQYKRLQHLTDLNEKTELAKDIFSKVKIVELRYGKEYEIMKNFPQYNGLIETVNYLKQIKDIEIRFKKIEQIENAKYKIIRTIEKLDEININSDVDLTNDVLCSISTMFEAPEYRNMLTNKELYTLFINYFKLKENPNIMNKVVKEIAPINNKIWNKDLTNPNNFQNGEKFKFLIHNFTTGSSLEEQIYAMQAFRNNRISCSLITDSFVGIYDSDSKRRVGLIYPSDSKIITSGKKDLYTIEEGQDYIIKNKEYASNLLSPNFLEEAGKIQTAESNEEFDYSTTYNEVLIQNEEPCAVYLIGYGEKDINNDYQSLIELANKLDIPFVEIDMMEYRINKGLTPLGKKGTEYIVNQVVNSYFGLTMNHNDVDEYTLEQISEITKLCANDISNNFLNLKSTGNLSRENMNFVLDNIIDQKGLTGQIEAINIEVARKHKTVL